MKRIAAVTMSIVFISSNSGWAADKTGAAFLKINPSVRGEALGGLNPVSAFGAAGMTINPASLALMEGHELASGFASMMGDSQYGTIGIGLKRGEGAGMGASATFLRSGTLQGRDASGNATEAFSAQDMAAGVTGAVSFGESLHVGGTVKGVQESIGQEKSNTAVAGDLGAVLETGNVTWGAAALNLGGKLTFQGTKASLPAIYSLGASVPMGGGLALLGGVSQASGATTANMGMEYRLGPVNLRVGYRSDGGSNLAKNAQKSGAQSLDGITGGIGIVMKDLRIDYAVSQTAVEWGMGQRASVTWKWGGAAAGEERAEEKPRPAPKRPAPVKKAAQPVYKAAPQSDSAMRTGSHRAYDPQPIQKKKPKKRWVD